MNSPQLDHSVLRSSIDVSITGMKQAIHALENGNKEVCILVIIICTLFRVLNFLIMIFCQICVFFRLVILNRFGTDSVILNFCLSSVNLVNFS